MSVWRSIAAGLDTAGCAALVTLIEARGSTPRAGAARMAVLADGSFAGTIGGGTLEWQAMAAAGHALESGAAGGFERRLALGPDLGQCCGGQVVLLTEVFVRTDLSWIGPLARAEAAGAFRTSAAEDGSGRLVRGLVEEPCGLTECFERAPDGLVREQFGEAPTLLVLVGAGHVGRALVLALAPLPFRVQWIDPRAGAFPARVPPAVRCVEGDPAAELRLAPAGALVMVMSHSHAVDFEAVSEALANPGIGRVGLIGSASKRGRFLSRLAALGLGAAARERFVCPIGFGRIVSKTPAAIAAMAAVQLLEWREAAVDPVALQEEHAAHAEAV